MPRLKQARQHSCKQKCVLPPTFLLGVTLKFEVKQGVTGLLLKLG